MFLQRDQSVVWVFHGPLRAQGSNRLLFLMCSISENERQTRVLGECRPRSRWKNSRPRRCGAAHADPALEAPLQYWPASGTLAPPGASGCPFNRGGFRGSRAKCSVSNAPGVPAASNPAARRGPSCGCNSVGVSGRASRGRTGEAMWLWFCSMRGVATSLMGHSTRLVAPFSKMFAYPGRKPTFGQCG